MNTKHKGFIFIIYLWNMNCTKYLVKEINSGKKKLEIMWWFGVKSKNQCKL